MKRTIPYFLLLNLLLACESDTKIPNNDMITIKVDDPKEINFEDWFKVKKYIPLATDLSNSPYLKDLVKIRMDEENIFVLSENGLAQSLFAFDYEGNQKAYRRASQDGSKRFYNASDFTLSEDQLFLSHQTKSEIMVFNHALQYQQSIPIPEEIGIQNIFHINDQKLLFRPDFGSKKILESRLFALNPEQATQLLPVNEFPGILPTAYPLSYFENFTLVSDKKLLFFDLFSSKIWKVSPIEMVANPIYDIQLNEKLWMTTAEIQELDRTDLPVKHKYLNRLKKSYRFDFVHEAPDHIFFSFLGYLKRYFVVYHKETGENQIAYLPYRPNISNTVDGGPLPFILVGLTPKGDLIFIQSAEKFQAFAEAAKENAFRSKEAHAYLQETAAKITPACNQVLIIVELKK